MAGALGAMNSLLGKLAMLLGDEYAKHKKLQKHVRFLRDELNSIKAVLQKYSEMQNPDVQVKAWMMDMRELAYDIEDCIDAFIVRVQHEPEEPATGVKGLVRKNIRKLKKLVARHNIADEIQELKERVLEVKERRERYRLDNPTSMTDNVVPIDPRLSALYTEASELVGIDGPRDEIISLLTKEEEAMLAQKLKVVSIVGFGGLGKTTLAKQVFDTIKGQFDCVAFVILSQSPDIKKILMDILSQVGHKGDKMDDESQLINKLRKYLQNKRYFIIVDDIWSILAWDVVKSALLENNVGSRVITTTRIIGIARSCCSCLYGRIYNIQPLSKHDSRKLFLKRIFHSEYGCPPHLEEVSNAILRKCGGVPLAILCISSLLAGKPNTKDDWEQVKNSIGSELEKDPTLEGMKKILLLSYYDLPHYLKTCLLYLSIFPEDFKIKRKELIWRWIGEGFVVEERGKRLDQVGEGYFNDLINRSLIQPVDIKYNGRAQYCQVHDLVLNITTSLSDEENFVTILNRHNCSSLPSHVRRLSVQINDLDDAAMKTIIESPSHVRSLVAFGIPKQTPNLLNFRALRVLDFYYYRESWNNQHLKKDHIESIGYLFQLRYLRLGYSGISELPNQIGNFQYLEVLDIRYCPKIKFPKTIGGMRKLLRLHVHDGVKLPDEIGNMQALEELSSIFISGESTKFLEGLGQLTNLRELEMFVCFKMENDGGRYREILVSSLRRLARCSLQSLTITCQCGDHCILDLLMTSNCNLPNLQKLCIYRLEYCRDKQFPNWISMLVNLVHLELESVRMDERDLHILKGISTLQFLKLFSRWAPNEKVVLGSHGFQCLKEFDFFSFHCGMWLQFAPGAIPKLQRLKLKFNVRRTKSKYGDFDFGIEHLSSLQRVWVASTDILGDIETNEDGAAAYAAVRKACTIHPNHPVLDFYGVR